MWDYFLWRIDASNMAKYYQIMHTSKKNYVIFQNINKNSKQRLPVQILTGSKVIKR